MKKLIYSQEDLDLILSLEIQEKEEQINQLTNNWNELEEWAKEQLMYFNENNAQSGFSTNIEDLEMFLDKMKEIKEKNNDTKD